MNMPCKRDERKPQVQLQEVHEIGNGKSKPKTRTKGNPRVSEVEERGQDIVDSVPRINEFTKDLRGRMSTKPLK